MKRTISAIAAIAVTSVTAFSQGVVFIGNNNAAANGFVVVDPAGHLSSSTASYTLPTSFTVQLWALPGNLTTTAGIVGLDQYGYLDPANLVSDGFVQSTLPNTTGGGAFGGGVFDNSTVATVPNNTGGFASGAYTKQGVIALVAWTGTFANLAAAQSANAAIGIIAFVNNIGPGGADPNIPASYPGWNTLLNSPASAANGGSQDFILAPVAPVPEPATLTLAGLGGLASLMMLRRKKA